MVSVDGIVSLLGYVTFSLILAGAVKFYCGYAVIFEVEAASSGNVIFTF